MKLSAIILTKNEENMIADCLDSVKFCDEIVVINSESTDRTADIAKSFGAKVYEHTADSFAERRNFAKTKAKSTWLLYIDADERVSAELAREIKHVIDKKNNVYQAYRLQRKNFYLGKHPWPHIERLERLFNKDALDHWYGELHETAKVNGEVGDLEGFVFHYTHRNLEYMVDKTNIWSNTEARLRFNANHPKMTWWRFPRVMLSAFYDSYVKQKGYKAGTVGLVESVYQAYSMFITYAKLWEIQEK